MYKPTLVKRSKWILSTDASGCRKALTAAGRKFGFSLEMTDFDYGGERYLRTGKVLPGDSGGSDNSIEQAGIDRVLNKPFDDTDLKEAITLLKM
jgi:hypothetical protein